MRTSRNISVPTLNSLAIYIHIPFCQRKCPYCDFNTFAGREGQYDHFVRTLAADIERVGDMLGNPSVRTLFLGGGTPTVLEPRHLERLFQVIHDAFHLLPHAEITSEANPGTIDQERFLTLRALGVNRLSMGVQSFQDDELHFLGRIHSANEALGAFRLARKIGFENINLDFMFGLPGQSPKKWRQTLQTAMALQPEHLSLYSLSVEPNTPLATWVARGQVNEPDPDLAADFYDIAREMLVTGGYVHYEISNWAQGPLDLNKLPRYASHHNLVYWQNEPYWGFGPGAHSWFGGMRRAVVANIEEYIHRVENNRPYWEMEETIDRMLEMGETMMLGLRLVQAGVSRERFRQRFGIDMFQVWPDVFEKLRARGLIIWDEERVRLTEQAFFIGNEVFMAFLP